MKRHSKEFLVECAIECVKFAKEVQRAQFDQRAKGDFPIECDFYKSRESWRKSEQKHNYILAVLG